MCINHPKILASQKLPFRFVWFEEFSWVCYCWWEDRTYCASFALFNYKNEGKSLQKTISKMENSSKNIRKTSKCSNGNTQKETNILSKIFWWIRIVSNPIPFTEEGRGTKILKNWVGVGTSFLKKKVKIC